MSDILEPIKYETGVPIRSYNIIEIIDNPLGYEVILDIDLDSGYDLKGVKMEITHDDLTGYETDDIEKGIKYALGFFDK